MRVISDNKILWNNEMCLAICLATELDEKEFETAALQSHIDLTGDTLCKGEYIVDSDMTIRKLEVI